MPIFSHWHTSIPLINLPCLLSLKHHTPDSLTLSSLTDSPAHPKTIPPRSSTQDHTTDYLSCDRSLDLAGATLIPPVVRDHKSTSENSSLYQTPPATPPSYKRPRQPPPRRRQKRDSWNALIGSGEFEGMPYQTVPKTSLTLIGDDLVQRAGQCW